MSQIRTKPATEEYREGWDRIFSKEMEHLEDFNKRVTAYTPNFTKTFPYNKEKCLCKKNVEKCKNCGH
jgi:hypothetical protein